MPQPHLSELRESGPRSSRPIRDLGLTIAGSALEPVVAEFEAELRRKGLTRLRPRFYLSTEWGVPDGTIAIAIPFYLAHPELTDEHARRAGHVEGNSPADVLRYLRHEMGHVVNYAYRLYDTEGWVEQFGAITQPYLEDYRPEPFSRRFVRHLPGWYAQKHPDEDWAETFAVWMTPGLDWRAEYADWPVALAKLEYCDRTMAELSGRDPLVTADEPDLDVSQIGHTVEQFYAEGAGPAEPIPPGLDGSLRAIFEDLGHLKGAPATAPRKLASALIDRLEPELIADVYCWTGHFPERTRPLLRHLSDRADRLRLLYPEDHEAPAVVALTCFVTALAMNYVHGGSYIK
jgi:hypothetical protein